MPLARRGYLLVTAASAVAAVLTCTSPKGVLAFDKQVCATAYESAQQLRNELKLRRAREQLLVCGHSSCPAVVTKDCNFWLTQVDAALASVVFRVRDERGQPVTDVRILMDGQLLSEKIDGASVLVDPGSHNFRFESSKFITAEQRQMLPKAARDHQIDVRLKLRSEEQAVRSEAPDEPLATKQPPELEAPPSPASAAASPGTATYVAGGMGLLALSSFAYFGMNGNSDAARLRDSGCAPTCAEKDVNAARSKLIAANVSLGVGITALGVAAIVWAVQGSSSPTKTTSGIHGIAPFVGVSIDVRPAPLGGGAQLVTTLSTP